jgi:hypothetical protein
MESSYAAQLSSQTKLTEMYHDTAVELRSHVLQLQEAFRELEEGELKRLREEVERKEDVVRALERRLEDGGEDARSAMGNEDGGGDNGKGMVGGVEKGQAEVMDGFKFSLVFITDALSCLVGSAESCCLCSESTPEIWQDSYGNCTHI